MKCKKVRNHMEEYLDGVIAGSAKDEIERHLDNCADCLGILRERQRWGEMLSGSLKKISSRQEPSPDLVRLASTIADGAVPKLRRPVVPSLRTRIAWPKLAAVGLMPLIALVIAILLLQKLHDQNRTPAFRQPESVSYMKLTTTHYAGNSSDVWISKKVRIQTNDHQSGSLTLEISKKM